MKNSTLQDEGTIIQKIPLKIKVAKYLGYFALIDLLFLPYFQLIIFPISLPFILMAILFFQIKIKRDQYLFMYSIIFIFAILSVFYSLFIPSSQEFLVLNIKRVGQFLLIFSYFFYFRWLASMVELRIKPIIIIFVIYFSVLLLYFLNDPKYVTTLLNDIYGRVSAIQEHVTFHSRYSYIFSDPNSAGFFLLIAISPLFLEQRSVLSLVILYLGVFILLIMTQSRGSFISYALVYLSVNFLNKKILHFSLSRKLITVLLLTAIIVPSIIYIYNEMDLELRGVDRIFGVNYSDAGVRRINIWENMISNLYPLPIGRGYAFTYLEYSSYPEHIFPHSDFFRLLYSYGFVTLFVAIWFFFSKIMTLPSLIIPAFITFFMNSLIDSQKLFGLFLSLLAIMLVKHYRLFSSKRKINI